MTGYESEIVIAFIKAHGERGEDGRFATLVGKRVLASSKDQIARWEKRDTVPLHRVDEFLIRYGLMLYELDDWATAHYGRTGWSDPRAEPAELAA